MKEYIIRETEDFLSLSTLFHESGMGVTIEERKPERIIKMWRMDSRETGELMAASTLEIRGGVYCLGDIAVRNDLHRKGYGRIMQKTVFEEAAKRNIKELWACAKEPEYYRRCGWEKTDWDSSPDIAVYCSICEKRGTVCRPEIMKYTLK
ncbi:MAG: GNAT family N-acetyltransferase [Clostridia bacterium]|nr:GNAT family N-acetyltransferase [Clostridia bacterium]MBR5773012.1 GNAT family N-acetyltransferase [Clostridia bacterium]